MSTDLTLRLTHIVSVHSHSPQRLYEHGLGRLARVAAATEERRPEIASIDRKDPSFDHLVGRAAVSVGRRRFDYLHYTAELAYGGHEFPVPREAAVIERSGLRSKQFITVHNGFDPNVLISSGRGRATKCYPHFGRVVSGLRAALSGVIFVQIGTHTSERIAECDLCLVNKTTLGEAAGLIADAVLHIDNDGGLVHLGASVGTRCAVLFGPTPSDYFGYPENINFDPPVCGNCWCLTRTWMDTCAMGHDRPPCMQDQDPRAVVERLVPIVANLLHREERPVRAWASDGSP